MKTAPLFLALALGTGSLGAAPAVDDALIAEMRGFFEKEMARLKIPCLSIALVDGDRIAWQDGFGIQDEASGRRASESTVYRVGSISKLVTAVAVMQLAEKSLLDIDAPIVKYRPELVFVNPFNPETPIALRHLLCHRSGILRESPVGNYFDDSSPGIEKTVRSFAGTRLVYPVGQKTKYSNLGPTLAGYILEKASGERFAEYVEANIFRPAGMSSSSFFPEKEAVRKNLAKAFMVGFDGSCFPAPTFVLGTIPAGNLYSTAGDLARFLIALMEGGQGPGGRILEPATVERMFEIQFAGKDQTSGFGLGFFANRFHGRKTVNHSGAVYGFASAFTGMPAEKLGVIVLNDVDCANGFNDKVVRKALGLMLNRKCAAGIPPLPEPVQRSPKELEEYAGKYSAGRREAWAYLEDGGLRLRILGAAQVLSSLGGDRFISDGRLGYGAEYEFLRGPDRRIAGLKEGASEYRKVPDYKPSSEVPEEHRRFAGEYGWPHNILKVYGKDGKLTCLVEWFFEYPLEPLGGTAFAFPDYGLYEGERIEFVEDPSGRIVEARMGSVPFKRIR